MALISSVLWLVRCRKGWWTAPAHPNASSVHFLNDDPGCPAGAGPHNMDCPPKHGPNHLGMRCNALPGDQTARITSGCVCPPGCVFDIESDPVEQHDLSASLPAVKAQLAVDETVILLTLSPHRSWHTY